MMTPEQDYQSTVNELRGQNEQLQAVCRLWIAANDAKEERIATLEGRVKRLRRQVWRLTRFVGRRCPAPGADRVRQLARP